MTPRHHPEITITGERRPCRRCHRLKYDALLEGGLCVECSGGAP